MGVEDRGGGIGNGGGEEVDRMEKAVFIGDGRLFEVAVAELDCVGDDKGVGVGVHDLEAGVVEHQ